MPETDNNLIRIRDLHFSRGHSKIFNGIDIDIPQGKITAIMGPSGTGKTTLLKLIGGQLKPQKGTIHFHGENIPAFFNNASIDLDNLSVIPKTFDMLFHKNFATKILNSIGQD